MYVNLYRMFNEQQILTYIGMAVVVVFVFYYIYKVSEVQHNVIEGLTNKKNPSIDDITAKDDASLLKKTTEKLSDTLLVPKYRSDYEDMIIDLDHSIDYNILQGLLTLSSEIGREGSIDIKNSKSKVSTMVPLLNELYTLKKNLNSSMEFVDGHH